ncbi:hypothetical protein P872_08220 [Rhodonellum psychrophilum GCM71 = DSM 17998]|uniref:Uncharacterized protein n=1 Tax=Rhodonellum psychrophilum GCM71 = DSM 17998 TaxID=1123057 RepID=U5BNM0_9BACT|nr:hypothetical protein P872_08220 [Rhodonellum psychrophilum GCM71 = DSM 17998]
MISNKNRDLLPKSLWSKSLLFQVFLNLQNLECDVE